MRGVVGIEQRVECDVVLIVVVAVVAVLGVIGRSTARLSLDRGRSLPVRRLVERAVRVEVAKEPADELGNLKLTVAEGLEDGQPNRTGELGACHRGGAALAVGRGQRCVVVRREAAGGASDGGQGRSQSIRPCFVGYP